MTQKLTVITNHQGKVIATQLGHGDHRDPQSGIRGGIVAGPGQSIHKIEFDIPQLFAPADIDAFHDTLTEHLSTSKESPR
jgi:hypothetical protein